jgi:hypothetical protein
VIDPTRVSRATRQANDVYGQCAVCGQWQRLTPRGNLYQHQQRDRYGSATGEQCAGAGEPPKPEPQPDGWMGDRSE